METWIATLQRGITGVHVHTVRRPGRKRIPSTDAPLYVRQYLLLDQPGSTKSEIPVDLFTDLTPDDDVLRVTRPDPLRAIVTFRLTPPLRHRKPTVPKGVKAIRTLRQLCDHFGADEPHGLNRRIYKDTDCGASISLLLTDGGALHNGAPGWDTVTDAEVEGFTIQTIVEGSDAEVNSAPFLFPVRVAEVEAWMLEMEAEADQLWHEANEDGDTEESS